MKRYYIAYGSNLNLRQMSLRCPGALILGTAEIKDYELLFKGSKTGAYLTIEPKKGGIVPVVIWSVTEEDEKRLDCYEGYPDFYYKEEMRITYEGISSGKRRTAEAFVYIMDERRTPGIPSRRYIDTCLEGYRSFGFDPKFIEEAIRKSEVYAQ